MRYVRFKFRCNILISGKIIKELPGLVGSGTPDISLADGACAEVLFLVTSVSPLGMALLNLYCRFTK